MKFAEGRSAGLMRRPAGRTSQLGATITRDAYLRSALTEQPNWRQLPHEERRLQMRQRALDLVMLASSMIEASSELVEGTHHRLQTVQSRYGSTQDRIIASKANIAAWS